MKQPKKFLTYEEQVELLKKKKLKIENDEQTILYLKRCSYYSLISGYKDIFKIEKNGDYRPDASIEKIADLYVFDEYLRNIFLHKIINIEKTIKSLYSYSFCQMFGETQEDYLNINNYNYANSKYRTDINRFISTLENIIQNPEKHPYVDYNISTYGTVPFWIIIQVLTFGTISKMFTFSKEQLQSQVSREFNDIYPIQLSSMLSVLTKFRNVCAHGERLYNYKTRKELLDLPLHKEIDYNGKKNDLFNVCICFKYLLPLTEFKSFIEIVLNGLLVNTEDVLGDYYYNELLKSMGFPNDWKQILLK